MSQFKKNLSGLPSIENVARIELFEEGDSKSVDIIKNEPGKTGSLVVYNYIQQEFGGLTPESAKIALELFAEHVESAKENPGLHPNIDRLFDVIEKNRRLTIKAVIK